MAAAERLPDITDDTIVTEPTTLIDSTPTGGTKKRKKRKRTSKNQVLSQFTIRSPPWSYVHLQQMTATGVAAASDVDPVTAHLHITAALTQFLGLHGAAIPIDILRTEGAGVWIRVPADDYSTLLAAVGGWVSGKGEGWRVMGSSSWDARAMARDGGQDLFDD
ncbi:hypothetical protein LTR53_009194 [Teratosphaeriaceae sp. CCFEE 6253]|nr:hypothetical protein LTR53_009194 [Teratosphaeriaceae sp. CCFEE 6253]